MQDHTWSRLNVASTIENKTVLWKRKIICTRWRYNDMDIYWGIIHPKNKNPYEFLMQNTKDAVLKDDGNHTDLLTVKYLAWKEKAIQVWHDTKWWQKFHNWVSYPFKTLVQRCLFLNNLISYAFSISHKLLLLLMRLGWKIMLESSSDLKRKWHSSAK